MLPRAVAHSTRTAEPSGAVTSGALPISCVSQGIGVISSPIPTTPAQAERPTMPLDNLPNSRLETRLRREIKGDVRYYTITRGR
jgi:hypothetical protein